MSQHAGVRLLVNPAAGRGRALRRLDAARHALAHAGPFDVVTTRAAGDEARLASDAVRDGVHTLVVLGGDGTVSRVASSLIHTNTALAILGAGTGNDLAKSLGAPVFDYAAMAERVAARNPRRIDVGEIDGRVFVNAVGIGFDVAVLQRTARARWLRGDLLYAVTALGQLFRYRGLAAQLSTTKPLADPGVTTNSSVRSGPPATTQWLMIVVANGQWFGGAFRIAPDAQLADGLLDLVAISDTRSWRRAILFSRAPWGAHIHAPEVLHVQQSEVRLTCDTPPMYEADGELYRATETALTVRSLPRALLVIT